LHCETSREVELIKTLDLKLSDTFILKTANTKVKRDVSVRQLTTDIRQVRRHVWSVF
jgi:predicted metal-dependent enzyme (double-stranded beta helix superfamily)